MNVRHEGRRAETEELTALALESVDNVEGGDGLALGVLGVGDGVTDDTLEEGLEDTAGLLVDHGGDTLDTTTASETADSGLGDTLDVVTQDLAVTLGTALAETLATLSTWRKNALEDASFLGRDHGVNLRPDMMIELKG
jgi:hypothetical protein